MLREATEPEPRAIPCHVLPHRVKRHRSAQSIVREFLGPQLEVLPEELVWVPAHPSYPDDGGFTYDEMLKAVRQQRHWAFVRVPKDTNGIAVVHFYAAKDVPLRAIAAMLGHELGHISGSILDDDAAEEERADLYGKVAAEVLEMLTQERTLAPSTSRADRASRRTPSRGRAPVRRGPGRSPTPSGSPAVQVRRRPKG